MLSFSTFAAKIFGTSNDRKVKAYKPRVEAINQLEPELQKLSDSDLRSRTEMFRKQLADGVSLEDLLVPAFATVREAARRALGQRHFDVQLIGGMVLHDGKISEMKTGEGKTLVATAPVYLNALTGRGVHVVTVNDYLAKRDSEWMGAVYKFLGLTVGCIVHELDDAQRRVAYDCDVTYGTNNEFGFDYLRDNMKMSAGEMVQFGNRPAERCGHYFAIVDEVDSILVDEARTPLIISGPVEDRSELYTQIDALVPRLEKSDYELDEKQRQIAFTETGNEKMEKLLGEAGLLKAPHFYDIENVTVVHHAQQALKAHRMFQRDRDYIVKDGQVVIIDEFTGRMMPGRRYSDGLHQALEAKESVAIQPENQTLASITFQNYFRLFEKLAGMTGTAATEASEFMEIYGLDVVEIPTNKPVARLDMDDEVYRTAREKWSAIIRDVESAQARKQPVLVGTVSIEKSEQLSEQLKAKGIPHQVLNARYHEQEAFIIAQAGVPGAVTIATNMAGRGTDIQLGGNVQMRILQECQGLEGAERERKIAEITEEVARNRDIVLTAAETAELEPAKGSRAAKTATYPGGLYVIGTERHESRRIDNQLRGRSGRQGDPGRTRFYLSLEDDLMRIFAADRLDGLLKRLGMQEGEAITSPLMNKALENAQRKVEARNFDSRKYVLKYDDVMNDQRKVIFEQRLDIMGREDVSDTIVELRTQVIAELVAEHIPENAYAEQWNVAGLKAEVDRIFGLDLPIDKWAAEEGIADQEIRERLTKEVEAKAERIATEIGQRIKQAYDNSKGLVGFVDSEPELKALLEGDPSGNLGGIGQFLINSKRGEIRLTGGSKEDATHQADRIGFGFLREYMEARGLTQTIDSSQDKSPAALGRLQLREIEKSVLLQTLDHLWREHLVTLEHLRQVIGFRSYAQRDPLNEYKSESFQIFEAMLARLRQDVTGQIMHVEFSAEPQETEVPAAPPPMAAAMPPPAAPLANGALRMNGAVDEELALADAVIKAEREPRPEPRPARPEPVKMRRADAIDPKNPATWGKVARNDKCPCGSGKKYKKCHGADRE